MPATLPQFFRLQAALTLSPAQGDQPPRFAMTAYDGGLLEIAGAPAPVVVDLAGVKPVEQVKALLHHDTSRPVGHMTAVRISNTIETEGVLSVPGEARDQIIQAQRGEFEWEASIGCVIGEKQLIPRGQRVQVNGRTLVGPLIVARRATLREVSFVGAGAGENTSATIAATAVPIPLKACSMSDESTKTTDETSTPPDATVQAESLDELKALRAEIKADLAAIKAASDALKQDQENLARQRSAESVDTLAAQLGVSDSTLLVELKQKAAAGEIKSNEIELRLLRASRASLAGFQPLGGKSGAPAAPHVIEAALCLTSGWNEQELEKHFDAKTIEASLSNKFRGFGPRAMMIEYLQAHGHHVIGGTLQSEDIQAGVHLAEAELRNVRAAGGFSTISLPGILSNVAKKELLRGYDAVESPILKIARRATATDYKPFFMYRMTTNGLLEQIGADGEFKSIALLEDEYQSRVYPWGKKLAITEVMFRNDDLGAFNDLARLFGLTTKRTISKSGFTALLSQRDTFWTTGKKNRLAGGAGSALSHTSLGDAYQLFLQAEDASGEPIDLEPKYLLVAPSDKVLAGDLNRQTTLNLAVAGATDTVVEKLQGNSFQGMFEPLHSPHLAHGKVTNANGTQWMLCADPAITSPIVAAFLDGREGPRIKTWESLPGKMGMQWDVDCSFGFNLHDDKAAVFSPGQ